MHFDREAVGLAVSVYGIAITGNHKVICLMHRWAYSFTNLLAGMLGVYMTPNRPTQQSAVNGRVGTTATFGLDSC